MSFEAWHVFLDFAIDHMKRSIRNSVGMEFLRVMKGSETEQNLKATEEDRPAKMQHGHFKSQVWGLALAE